MGQILSKEALLHFLELSEAILLKFKAVAKVYEAMRTRVHLKIATTRVKTFLGPRWNFRGIPFSLSGRQNPSFGQVYGCPALHLKTRIDSACSSYDMIKDKPGCYPFLICHSGILY